MPGQAQPVQAVGWGCGEPRRGQQCHNGVPSRAVLAAQLRLIVAAVVAAVTAVIVRFVVRAREAEQVTVRR